MFQFIESRLFERLVYDYLDDEGYGLLQSWLAQQPESGDLVPHSGGCRKLRDGRIWLLTIYGKGATGNIPGHLLKAMKEEYVDAETD